MTTSTMRRRQPTERVLRMPASGGCKSFMAALERPLSRALPPLSLRRQSAHFRRWPTSLPPTALRRDPMGRVAPDMVRLWHRGRRTVRRRKRAARAAKGPAAGGDRRAAHIPTGTVRSGKNSALDPFAFVSLLTQTLSKRSRNERARCAGSGHALKACVSPGSASFAEPEAISPQFGPRSGIGSRGPSWLELLSALQRREPRSWKGTEG